MSVKAILRKFAVAPLPLPADWYAIPLRLIVGAGFVEHGYAKLARGPEILIAMLLVATFTVHLPNGFSSIKLLSYDAAGAHFGQPGYETDLLYIAGLLALCVGGAGPISLDRWLKRRHFASCGH